MKTMQMTADELILTKLVQAYADEGKARNFWKRGAGPKVQYVLTARTLVTNGFPNWRPKAQARAAFARASIFAAPAANNSR
jgi:hypothetical protein